MQVTFAGSPTETLSAFKKSIDTGDLEAAWGYIVIVEGLPEDSTAYLKDRVERFIKMSKAGWSFDIVKEKIEGKCAVVLINEKSKDGKKTTDYDPAYLIKQNGEWKLMPKVSSWDMAEQIDKDSVASFEQLKLWFDAQKNELKKQE